MEGGVESVVLLVELTSGAYRYAGPIVGHEQRDGVLTVPNRLLKRAEPKDFGVVVPPIRDVQLHPVGHGQTHEGTAVPLPVFVADGEALGVDVGYHSRYRGGHGHGLSPN